MDEINILIEGAISKWPDGWPNIHCDYLYYSGNTNDYAVTDKYMIKPNSGKLNKNYWELVCSKFEFDLYFNKKLAEMEVKEKLKVEPELHNQKLLETYTGLAMQALIARGENLQYIEVLSGGYAKAAIKSMSDNND